MKEDSQQMFYNVMSGIAVSIILLCVMYIFISCSPSVEKDAVQGVLKITEELEEDAALQVENEIDLLQPSKKP